MPIEEGTILVVDESRPRLTGARRGVPCIAFRNPRGRPVDGDKLLAAIDQSGRARQFTQLSLDADSTMTTPWVATRFPNVRHVHLAGASLLSLDGLEKLRKLNSLTIDTYAPRPKRSLALLPSLRLKELSLRIALPEDHAAVAGCTGLEELQLIGWKDADLSRLAEVAPIELQLERGAMTSLAGLNGSRLRHLMLQRCSALRDAGGVAAPTMTLEACNSLELMSLARVDRLRSLTLHAQKGVTSLDFVRHCSTLAHLHLGLMPLKNLDLAPLAEGNSLRLVWLSTSNKNLLGEVARTRPELTVGCATWTFAGGKVYRGRARYDRMLRALARENDQVI